MKPTRYLFSGSNDDLEVLWLFPEFLLNFDIEEPDDCCLFVARNGLEIIQDK
jgi:hypothetical protein